MSERGAGTTFKTVWRGAREPLQAAEALLTEALHPPPGAVSLTKDDENAEDAATRWRLEAWFGSAPDIAAIDALLARTGAGPATPEDVPDIDWVAHALAGLGIVRAGRFLLYGVHDADKLPDEEGLTPIRIDANQAFGTGHHPTTAGCLTLLDRLAGIVPERILDLGTGSAVLAIAAAKLWGRRVLASDIDPVSVGIARENAALNGVGDAVSFFVSDGFAHPALTSAAPFDFVFANILAGPLVELAPAMAGRVKAGGRVMLAGLMADQEERVAAAYAEAGFRMINRLDHATWPVLLFVRL